ncbi:unnamed protein product [Moneuplotes crassus]|uniref:SYO1-like TPR repeats domain-containing protein n=1 Tax=Euplotes crassus TaxID=5936 RepID=A0AAD1X7Y8_EUPCR|nr:unnamed protein product [Moneuplotes crassus]
MPKHRSRKAGKKQIQQAKFREIQKRAKEYFAENTPDDQKSLYDRIGNQDPKVREMAYITLSTIDINPLRGLGVEIFNDEMTKRVIDSLNDPIRKNSLCVFASISNILNSADLYNKPEVLASYLEKGLLDVIKDNLVNIGVELTSNWGKMHKNDTDKALLYIENSYKLLDTIVVLESICVEENLDFISQHEGLLETTIQIMISKECDYVKEDKIWVNESILYWLTHFLYSLTKDNPGLCDKIRDVSDIGEYITSAISSLEESNIHICSNLSGLSFNLSSGEFIEKLSESESYVNFVHIPATKILIGMNSPQYEFNENFSDNIEHIKGSLSSNNEEEETISNTPPVSNDKLSQIISDFLNEMSGQVKKWKNFAIGHMNALEILSQVLVGLGPQQSEEPDERAEWIISTFTTPVTGLNGDTTLFLEILKHLQSVTMKTKVNLEEIHGIGGLVIDVQYSACEVLIDLLIAAPQMFFDPENEKDSRVVVETVLNALKFQNYASRFVECGLRFLGLYSKNFPEMMRSVLEENKASESFLQLVESVKDTEMIVHGLTILSAMFSTTEHTAEDNERICKLLLHYIQSPNLRVICESLNAIFDIYSEENFDPVLVKLDIVPKLETSLSLYHQMMKDQVHLYEEEEMEFFGEILENLEEFIKYKKEHM